MLHREKQEKELQKKEVELNELTLQLDENNSKTKELKGKCTQLQDSKHHLQLDAKVVTLRSQISKEQPSLDTAQKILTERDKQLARNFPFQNSSWQRLRKKQEK